MALRKIKDVDPSSWLSDATDDTRDVRRGDRGMILVMVSDLKLLSYEGVVLKREKPPRHDSG